MEILHNEFTFEFPLKQMANVTRTNHIMWTMGDDFQYQYAESWFKQMDKLIHYVNKAETVVSSALWCLTSSTSNCTIPTSTFSQCPLLNISYCPPAESIPSGKTLVVVAYNPLGWNRTDVVKIPVKDGNLIVQDKEGKTTEAQFIEFDNVSCNLRSFYTEAYLGISPPEVPEYWPLFQASVPPLGWNTSLPKQTQKGIYP